MSESVEVTVARVEGKIDVIVGTLADIKETVYGNGKVGLKTEVDRLVVSDTKRAATLKVVIGGFVAMFAALAAKIAYDVFIFLPDIARLIQHKP